MKTILILVVSSEVSPYGKMISTSQSTWDSVEVDGVETIYYCGKPDKPNTDKVIYLPVDETLFNMGHKMIGAFEWALKNKTFDYIARVNSSCYVDKKELIKYVQTLPDNDLFAGLEVKDNPRWMWGGGMFTISKDVVQKLYDNRNLWDHQSMEDASMSRLADKLNIPFTNGFACSIDKLETCWRCMCYGGGAESFEFTDFADIKKAKGQFYFRVKQDYDRSKDEFIMNELFKCLN